jgi:hypothetical protein
VKKVEDAHGFVNARVRGVRDAVDAGVEQEQNLLKRCFELLWVSSCEKLP